MNVTLVYDGTTLTESITDPITNSTAIETYTVNIPSLVGGSTAYVGFTGATGGIASTQNILTWSYSLPVVSPNAPSGLGGAPATATSVNLNWTNNAANQTGFHLDRATDSGFTQNLVTQSLPATPFTFTDTAIGLAPGATYYYRLRAFNSAGDSGNSNTLSVIIPVAPPKPTNQSVTGVTTTEIDIQWQDNAGHAATEYDILRAVNHGSFSQVATLPPTSRPAPSDYDWSDTGLTPGYFYEYHIEAVNSSGNNDFAGVNATTITLPPTSLSVSTAGNSVHLSWTAPANGVVSYNIYRSTTSGGESGNLLVSGVTATNYTDSTAVEGAAYYYKVTADNGNGTYTPPLPSESGFSNEAAVLPIVPISAKWNSATADSWNTAADWVNGTSGNPIAPPGLRGVIGDTVLFAAAGGSPVRLDGTSPTVAAITLDNTTSSYTISQGSGGTLQLNNGTSNALITVAHGSHAISAPVLLNSNLSIAPASGTNVTLSGAIAGAGESLTVNGQGTVLLSGPNSYSGGTVVLSGKLVVTNPSSLLDGSSLTVGNWMAPAGVVPAPIAKAATAVVSASPAASAASSPASMTTPQWPRATSASGSVGPSMAASRLAIGRRAADSVMAGRTSAANSQRGAAITSSWPHIPTDNDDRAVRALDAVLARFGA
jgi:autotransporter-associated beta strand protein